MTHRVTIRHRDGVTPKMRLKFGTRILNIRAVINAGERNRTLELLCEEGVGTYGGARAAGATPTQNVSFAGGT